MPLPRHVTGVALCVTAIIIGLFPMHSIHLLAQGPAGNPPNALGNAPCVWFFPIENPDHTLNVQRTIELLQKNGFGCQAMPIEDKPPYDWWDFQQLVAAADKAGIDTWPVLIPPSEGGNSLPYATDYVTWFKVLAKLSLRYPHLRGVNIDDMVQGISPKTFTRDYVCELYRDKKEINPQFLAIPTVYDLDSELADRLAGCVDGVWMTWTNLETATGFVGFLKNSRLAVKGRFPIYAPVYAHATSWHKQGDPLPASFLRTLNKACQYSDGIVLWNLSLLDPDPLLAIARTFTSGGSSQYAGRCAESLQPAPSHEQHPAAK
jgi:hypothetical protein